MLSRREIVVGLAGGLVAFAVMVAGARRWFEGPRPDAPAAKSGTFVEPTAEQRKNLIITSIVCYGPEAACSLKGDLDVVLAYPLSFWSPETKRQVREVSLVIGGIDFPHITARPIEEASTTLKFTLDPNVDAAQWKRLYANQDETAQFAVALAAPTQETTVGKTPDLHFVSNAVMTTFDIRADVPTSLIYLFLGFLVVALVCLGLWSNLLRDAGPEPDSPAHKPFSLARTQLALWTVVVVGAYLFIWTVLGTKNPLNQTALILIGVSALTGLTATAIDDKKAATNPAAAAVPKVSLGFWSDLLSDEDGFAISRMQMVVWTLALAFVFGYSVWTDLAMPDYDTVLLGLLGVSNGTYVGLKLT
jgi:hypothetical protein